MRIGILTHNYPLQSGESRDAGRFVSAFTHELAKNHQVFVLCPRFEGGVEKDKQVPVVWFNWNGGKEKLGSWKFYSPRTLIKFVSLIWSGNKAVLDFCRENKPDYLLCFWNFPAGIWGWYAKRIMNIPFATWALGSDIFIYTKFPLLRQLIRTVLASANLRFGNSNAICRKCSQLCHKKTIFLPSSIDLLTKKVKIPKLTLGKFHFLFLGRLEKIKGPDVLIKAAVLLAQKMRNFSVTLIGGGSLEIELKKMVEDGGIKDLVHIMGYQKDQALVNGFLESSDCLIIPSRSESFPLVITEALQTGLPIIGADVGDMVEFVKKNGLGFVFKPEDAVQLQRKMLKMIRCGKDIRRKNSKLVLMLFEKFKLKNVTSTFVNLIQKKVNL